MKVVVQVVNEKGRSVSAKERVRMAKYRGELRVNEMRSHALGRIAVMAQLVSDVDGSEPELLPALHDAAVLFLRNGQMRIRGVEAVDDIQYGQTWDVKVA